MTTEVFRLVTRALDSDRYSELNVGLEKHPLVAGELAQVSR